MKYTIYLFFLLILAQCQSKHTDNVEINQEKEIQENPYEGYDTHEISLVDAKVKIQVPGVDLVGKEPQVSTGNSGVTNMKIGKNFHLEILEGKLNIEETISDLGKDIFYKITILSKDENQVIFEKSLPDGSQSFVNFMMNKNVDDAPVIVRSASNGQFRKAHVDRMMKSAATIDVNNEIVMNK
ncbi:MAG: hypothetical protein ACI8XB_000462 [Patiriisocius sp.]|jgi:hypothetical protein